MKGYLIIACALTLLHWVNPNPLLADDYRSVAGPCNFVFPRDHGPHPGYRLEWWYYTGNLTAPTGKRYGFQLTFFQTQMSPPEAEAAWPDNKSSWRTNRLYFAHAALSDLDGKRFFHDERMARGSLGLAGAEQRSDTTRVFLGPWSAEIGELRHRLRAETDRFGLDLSLIPLKPPRAHGDRGYSRKGPDPKDASCYYSLSRLETSGFLTLDGNKGPVKGTAWMDHEYSSEPLEANLAGWDWFSIQLSDNTELMIYLLRKKDGGYSAASSGTFIDPAGKILTMYTEDFDVDVLEHWKSPHTNAVYPSRWRIRVHPLNMDLSIVPNLSDQELITRRTTRVTYWEGSVSVKGSSGKTDIEGVGYVEMTGYEKPFDLSE